MDMQPKSNTAAPTKVNRRGSNHLLSLLPRDDRERIIGRCERQAIGIGQVLHESGAPIVHVYFPLSGMISMVLNSIGGKTVEVGVVGNEGLLGTSVLLGSETSHVTSLIQVAGDFLRMTAKDLRAEAKRSPVLAEMAQHFAQSLMIQVSQSVMCNRLHSMDARICRWLLMAHDRAGMDQIGLTQQFISQMLGVRRASVTAAAGKLQHAGLITYARSRITVLDRAGMEGRACECYNLANRALEKLLRR
jgi:CRP-like cAMP-binding protein